MSAEVNAAPLAVAAVVIGRDEGRRLALCLDSLKGRVDPLIYVDSGSADDSVAAARAAGAEVVELAADTPFTAARARNAGAALLLDDATAFVQFVDGDCEMAAGWIPAAEQALRASPDLAAVAGRLRERQPELSIYNRMCDLEWDAPAGEAESCGGVAMMRLAAFRAVDGFRDDLAAGEEPELCLRLRRAGWRILRLADEMALHDADITRFGQWWLRCQRGGQAAAEAASLHGRGPERFGVARLARALAWGAAAPAAIAVLALIDARALALTAIYPAQIIRLAVRDGATRRISWEFAVMNTLAKFAEAAGGLSWLARRWSAARGPARG